jgi:penicillin amidase
MIFLPFKRLASLAALTLALTAGGLQARPVTIKRDTYGVPHVYADTTYGLFYGYGYAVAEDRLYQMEMVKRSAEGTVAQVLGGAYLATDKATRGMFDPASLHRQLAALPANDRAMFEGYAAGFNARIHAVMAQPDKLLPRQFVTAGFQPSSWSADDVAAVWVGLILNRFFSGNMELANLNLLSELQAAKGAEEGEKIYHQLRWLEDPTAPTIAAPEGSASPAEAKADPGAAGLRGVSRGAALAYQAGQEARLGPVAAAGMPTASNAWVIAPKRSDQHHTVLYNGPQQGWFNPSIIYGIGLHGAGFDLTGTTPVGLPAVFFGSNGTIAWGSTVGALDTNDLYQETLAPEDMHRYRYNGAWRPMIARHEVIRVKGQADVPFTAWATVHGPVTGWDEANHTAYALKRSWVGHEIETLMGWAHVGQARDWDGFLKQAARVSASITWFYADGRGNIGYAGLGRLPDRPANQPVQFPARGDGSMEWRGTLPFSANPKQLNPPQGYLVSWNNKTMPGLKGDGADYSHIDRVNELAEALNRKPVLSDKEIWDVDRYGALADLNHRYFVPYITQAVAGLGEEIPCVRLPRGSRAGMGG